MKRLIIRVYLSGIVVLTGTLISCKERIVPTPPAEERENLVGKTEKEIIQRFGSPSLTNENVGFKVLTYMNPPSKPPPGKPKELDGGFEVFLQEGRVKAIKPIRATVR